MALRPQSNGQLDVPGTTWRLKFVRLNPPKAGMEPTYNMGENSTPIGPQGSSNPIKAAESTAIISKGLDNTLMSLIEENPGASVEGQPMKPAMARFYDSLFDPAFEAVVAKWEDKLQSFYAGKKKKKLPYGVVGINLQIRIPFVSSAYPQTLKNCYLMFTLPLQGPQPRTAGVRMKTGITH